MSKLLSDHFGNAYCGVTSIAPVSWYVELTGLHSGLNRFDFGEHLRSDHPVLRRLRATDSDREEYAGG